MYKSTFLVLFMNKDKVYHELFLGKNVQRHLLNGLRNHLVKKLPVGIGTYVQTEIEFFWV